MKYTSPLPGDKQLPLQIPAANRAWAFFSWNQWFKITVTVHKVKPCINREKHNYSQSLHSKKLQYSPQGINRNVLTFFCRDTQFSDTKHTSLKHKPPKNQPKWETDTENFVGKNIFKLYSLHLSDKWCLQQSVIDEILSSHEGILLTFATL